MIKSIHDECEVRVRSVKGFIPDEKLLFARNRIWAELISRENISLVRNCFRICKFLMRCALALDNDKIRDKKILVAGNSEEVFFNNYLRDSRVMSPCIVGFIGSPGNRLYKMTGHPSLRDMSMCDLAECWDYARSSRKCLVNRATLYVDWLVLSLEFHTWRNFWLRTFRRCDAKVLLVKAFYSHDRLAASLAARETGTVVIDLQHGKQSLHSFYDGLSSYRESPLLPNYFAVWSQYHADTIGLVDKSLVVGKPFSNLAADAISKPEFLERIRAPKHFLSYNLVVVVHQSIHSVDFLLIAVNLAELCESNGLKCGVVLRLHPNTALADKLMLERKFRKLRHKNLFLDQGGDYAFDKCMNNFDGIVGVASTTIVEFAETGKNILLINCGADNPFKDLMMRTRIFNLSASHAVNYKLMSVNGSPIFRFLKFDKFDTVEVLYPYHQQSFDKLLAISISR